MTVPLEQAAGRYAPRSRRLRDTVACRVTAARAARCEVKMHVNIYQGDCYDGGKTIIRTGPLAGHHLLPACLAGPLRLPDSVSAYMKSGEEARPIGPLPGMRVAEVSSDWPGTST